MAAVAATAFAAGAALEHIAATLIDFVGLDHRVQLVGVGRRRLVQRLQGHGAHAARWVASPRWC
ncbi:MAG: hypothetical protein R2710_15570 [Acidimicrobiales bacterium]